MTEALAGLPAAMRSVAREIGGGEYDSWMVVAPTSYGKTRASPVLHRVAVDAGVAAGLVHVAPLRSLVEEIYERHFKPHGGAVQMHHPPPGARRSPYLLAGLVATTLDSFLWNLYRFPVAELAKIGRGRSRGHYYPALAAIYSSLVVLDEAHMALGGGPRRGMEAFTAALSHLAAAGTPLVVETATLHPRVLAEAARLAAASGRGVSIHVVGREGVYRDRVEDELAARGLEARWHPFEGPAPRWETRVEDGWSRGLLEEIAGEAGRRVVLVVANTVDRAAEIYGMLRGLGVETVLLHGRLSSLDRRAALERLQSMSKGGRGVVVATQVVEAGVDVNAAAVYTEAAPLENLVQRAGRACRRGPVLEDCVKRAGRVVVVRVEEVQPYGREQVEEALRLMEEAGCVDWRRPSASGGCRGYGDLLAETTAPSLKGGLWSSLLEIYLRGDAAPDALLSIEGDVLCGLYRSTGLVEVYIDEARGFVTASLDQVIRWSRRGLIEIEDGVPVIAAISGELRLAARGPAALFWDRARRGERKCGMLMQGLMRDLDRLAEGLGRGLYTWGFLAARDAYRDGLGLGVGQDG